MRRSTTTELCPAHGHAPSVPKPRCSKGWMHVMGGNPVHTRRPTRSRAAETSRAPMCFLTSQCLSGDGVQVRGDEKSAFVPRDVLLSGVNCSCIMLCLGGPVLLDGSAVPTSRWDGLVVPLWARLRRLECQRVIAVSPRPVSCSAQLPDWGSGTFSLTRLRVKARRHRCTSKTVWHVDLAGTKQYRVRVRIAVRGRSAPSDQDIAYRRCREFGRGRRR